MCIQITGEYGIIIRRASLAEKAISLQTVLTAFETTAPLDIDDSLVSFGPHFGGEALNNLTKRLTDLGLVYFDDFFDTVFDSPSWCTFKAQLTRDDLSLGSDLNNPA